MGTDDAERADEPEGVDSILLEWAEAVADGRPVDWLQAREKEGDLRESIAAFELVESLIRAHRAAKVSELVPPATLASARLHNPTSSSSSDAPSAWGGLQVFEKIGEGTSGEVYRAFDPKLDIEVALKLIRPERAPSEQSADRFFEEARRLARIRHPHVLRVYGTDRQEGRVGIWTDLVLGKTLEEMLAAEGTFGMREAVSIGIDLCGALAAVHAAGLVYRDLKAQNVIREQGGRLVLMDFGAASALTPPRVEERAYGTPLAAAPELIRGEPGTPESDIYALGVLLFRLVSGRYPIEADTYGELVERHRLGQGRALRGLCPDLPLPFVQVVERAIDPDPKRRFAGAGVMERALAGIGPTAGNNILLWTLSGMAALGLLALTILIIPSVIRRADGTDGRKPNAAATNQPSPATARDHVLAAAGTPVLNTTDSLSASAVLYRQQGGLIDPLAPGSHVLPGDALFMEIEPRESMYVYLFDEDEGGHFYLIFPLPGFARQNPLAAQTIHRLPGSRDGEARNWEISSAGGVEQIVAVGSKEPLDTLIQDFARADEPPLKSGALASDVRVSTDIPRGIGRTAAAHAQNGYPRMEALLRRLAPHHHLWIWKTQLIDGAPGG